MTLTSSKFVSTTGKLSLLTLALMAAPFAMAQDAGWYGGANIGQSIATIDEARITSGLLGSGLVAGPFSNTDDDLGFKIFGGYQYNKYFSVEAGYFDLGQFGFKTSTTPAGTLSGDIRIKGLNLDLVGTLPITEKFSAFGRIGAAYARTEDRFAGTGAVNVLNPNPSARDTNLKVGLGVQYAMTDALSLRAEIERYRINDAVGNKGDVDMASIGLVYRFGGKTPTPVAQTYTPAPVVIAQAPQPVFVAPPPAPPPPPRVPQKVSLSADALFDFDRSVVKPGGRGELDRLATDLRGLDFDVINVTGHTDRIGRQAYNQKLSTQRAEAVSTYLVNSAGIPASKINARGVNGSDPVTKPGDCVGTKVTPALIACLQPDRRVDIEVTGQR
ncbi:outer membrane beta-barrel protein [Rhodoferax sp.]|uniref:outer membrane beta-barrel protein n=1 Tax=Rhodoferax sp. TaxID=50421 RepID=UPI0025CFE070|nr:outer membrane beta-barrel protein [Rhodoferax sp.]MCM2341395.1 outer membrane beta-barrel protein [Rhodoferax sp.]